MNLLFIEKEFKKLKIKDNIIMHKFEPKLNIKSMPRHTYFCDLEKDFKKEIEVFNFSPYIQEKYADQQLNKQIIKYKNKVNENSLLNFVKGKNLHYKLSGKKDILNKFGKRDDSFDEDNYNKRLSQQEISKVKIGFGSTNFINNVIKSVHCSIDVEENKEIKKFNEEFNSKFGNNKKYKTIDSNKSKVSTIKDGKLTKRKNIILPDTISNNIPGISLKENTKLYNKASLKYLEKLKKKKSKIEIPTKKDIDFELENKTEKLADNIQEDIVITNQIKKELEYLKAVSSKGKIVNLRKTNFKIKDFS